MRVKRIYSAPPRVKKKNSWVPQPTRVMSFLPEKKFTIIFATVPLMRARSMREWWLSRKYIGVWSLKSIHIRRSRMKFPITAAS